MGELKQYRAFLSYSHKDSQLAKKLHQALENYQAPKSVKAQQKRSLGPVFRDEDELEAASNLSDRIKTALEQSEFLIVLASPNAKASKWVNDEIRFFREMKGDANILCALLHPDPSASFPEALLETGNEPLAAELTSKNFRLGLTQIAAPMLGVSLDDLIQRDLRKLRRRVTAITVSACAALLVMGSLTWAALSARQEAEQRRQIAEEQIEFMITDLKDDLETVGRLDALEAVAQRAVDYYEGYPLSDHDDDALGRRARVFHMLGDVQEQQGNLEAANAYFLRAYEATDALIKKSPQDADRVIEHAFSAFYLGKSFYRIKNYDLAEEFLLSYRDHIEQLSTIEGESLRVQQERIYAMSSLSSLYIDTGNLEQLAINLENDIRAKEKHLAQAPHDLDRKLSLAQSHIDYANLNIQAGATDKALDNLNSATSLLHKDSTETEVFFQDELNLITRRSLTLAHLFSNDLKKAEEEITKARKLVNHLIQIESENVDIRFQEFQLNLLEFNLAFIKADLNQAESLSKELKEQLENATYFEANDGRLASLKAPFSPLPLYLAILKMDKEKIHEESLQLEAKTVENAFNISATNLLDETFLYHLLTLYILGKTDASNELLSVCQSENIHLTFQQKSILSTVFRPDECAIAALDQAHPITSIRTAIHRYDALNQE